MLTADLEFRFGDPYDPGNPLGFAEILAADERHELLRSGEELLDGWGFNAEFVPVSLGGRWGGTDDLIRRIRPVFRRDLSLGLGYGVTSLMAAVNVWTSGSPQQRKTVSELLLGGGKLAVGYHELAHGNDFLSNELRARAQGGRLILDGSKQVINNVQRAAMIVVFARTDDRPGGRSHSIVLVDKSAIDPGSIRYLARHRTAGVRGCQLGGFELSACAVTPDAVLGSVGEGAETALRSFQITRVVMPGAMLGVLDASLRAAARFAMGRRLYSAPVSELPHVRATLATAFLDLTIAESLVTAAARGLHLIPQQSGVHAAAVKYLVPVLLEEAMDELSIVMGARGHLREGTYGIFGKHRRDLPVLGLGHAGGVACLLTMLPQLPMLARRAGARGGPPVELIDPGVPLPELDPARLALVGNGRDDLMAALRERDAGIGEPVAGLVGECSRLLDELYHRCAALPPGELGPTASPEVFELAERYAVLLAAAACVGRWRHHRSRGDGGFLAESDWIIAALTRLTGLLSGVRQPVPAPPGEALFAELALRLDKGKSFCLDAEPVHG